MRTVMGVVVVVMSWLGAGAAFALDEPVRTEGGLVSGADAKAPGVRVFKGIPFAAPPVGPLRWRAPQPAAKWSGVRRGDAFGPRCMQGGGAPPAPGAPAVQPMSEDCLYVNVWTAAASASEKRPVIVWSYGGAFAGGAGSLPGYDGEALARKGVVMVTYNYRVGPFGFFAHPELTAESGRGASGNYGVMDLVAALHWVQQNIAAFGGDPSRVTIMGESAGGALVATVMGSPEGKGLFHRVISQSAPVRIERMETRAAAEQAGAAAAARLGATSLAALRARPAAEIQKAVPGGRPIVDGWYVTHDVMHDIADGRHNDVPVLIGSNKDEGAFPFFGIPSGTPQAFTERTRQRFGALAPLFLEIYPSGTEADSNASQLASFRDEVAWNMRHWASRQAANGTGKAYLYYFTQDPPAPAGQPRRGAIHTAEVPYSFNNTSPLWTDKDRALAETMSSYWVNFAATGDPNGKGLPAWPAFSRAGGRLMTLGPAVEAAPALDSKRVALFDRLAEQ